MTAPFDYESVGLGISFQSQPVLTRNTSFEEPRHGHNHFMHEQNPIPKYHATSFEHRQPVSHPRAQSAMIPQRATFDQYSFSDRSYAPRSAMPTQRPFVSTTDRYNTAFTHSAPESPAEHMTPAYDYPGQVERPRETVFDRRARRMAETKPVPLYQHNAGYMPSPVDTYARTDASSNSGSSYFYMTPSVNSTPYSEAGQFPVPETYGSSYQTPSLKQSPMFEMQEEKLEQFEQLDEMPDVPYMPKHQPIPSRPPTTPRRMTEDTAYTMDSNDEIHGFASPSTSPPETPSLKDRKVAYSKWSSAEDLLLKDAIAKHGDGKWSLVAQMVPGRTPMQCSTRWQGALNTSIHKGRWDPHEDAILIKAVAEWQAWHLADNKDIQSVEVLQEELYKNIPWSNIAQLLPRTRTGVQALARWSEALDPRITKGKWTADEDVALLRGIQKFGKCWIKIANCVRGRTQRQCRTRYCQITDKKKKNVRTGHSRAGSPELRLSE